MAGAAGGNTAKRLRDTGVEVLEPLWQRNIKHGETACTRNSQRACLVDEQCVHVAGLPEEKAKYAEVMGVHLSVPAQQASHHPGADDGEKLPAFFPFAFRFLLAFCLSLPHVVSFLIFPFRTSFLLDLSLSHVFPHVASFLICPFLMSFLLDLSLSHVVSFLIFPFRTSFRFACRFLLGLSLLHVASLLALCAPFFLIRRLPCCVLNLKRRPPIGREKYKQRARLHRARPD